ncbi:TPA: flagellar biosynthesis protein FlhA [bacterium]|nr:flagellar biosynthesis protein FlhA [bacterium]
MEEAATIPQVSWMQKTDILVAVFILCVIAMMVVPLPPLLIDILIAGNIMLSMMIILTVIYVQKAIDFSVFPSLLLMATVYRLALEVSTSRMILLGRGGEIGIVTTFGSFVVGGNYIVGIIIFAILTIIQLIVIVRGTTRVSEVAARFTLDSMPGKQMAIDADLNAGYITEQEAIRRRFEIRKEADFYGSMDGAAKFVQGDVIAAIVIIIINIVGGLIIGVLIRHEPLEEAVRAYTTYTIGCGLSAQIPAFLISVATGILVSRSATDLTLGSDMIRQLTSKPTVLWVTAGGLFILSLTPLPKLPLIIFACLVGSLGYIMTQKEKKRAVEEEIIKRKEEIEKVKKPESVTTLLLVDPMELEIGYGLIPFVDPEQGGDFLDRITMIRRQAALEMGIVVPPIRIRDNIQLSKDTYVIKIRGVEVGGGILRPECFLAMGGEEEVPGEATTDPTFGLPAIWVKEENKHLAEEAGYTVVDAPSVMATHLTEVIKNNATELLGRQETQTLVNNIKEKYPTLVDELIPEPLTIGELQKVLHNLLRERVSVRNMVTILETLADWVGKTKDIEFLTEKVRQALSRQITNQYQTPDGRLLVITIDPKLEERITSEALSPAEINGILNSIRTIIGSQKPTHQPVILTSANTRKKIREVIMPYIPLIPILSYDEIAIGTRVTSIGTVS